jgi:hypothetical protein
MLAMKKGIKVYKSSEEILSKVADVIGPESGAAKALEEFKSRKVKGEDVAIYIAESSWIIGPDNAFNPAHDRKPPTPATRSEREPANFK